MKIEFNNIQPESKLWVFHSPKELEDSDKLILIQELESFLESWESHGQAVFGGYEIVDNQFILVSASTSTDNPSGCSTDKLIHCFSSIGQNLGINFMDNTRVYLRNENKKWKSAHFGELATQIKSGKLKPNDILANTQISKRGDFPKNWELSAGESWLKRKFVLINS